MKKFIIKILILFIIVYGVIFVVNYTVDIGNIFHNGINEKFANALILGKTCEWKGDDGKVKELLLSKTHKVYDAAIVGTSRVMYNSFDYDNDINIGLSASKIGNYYSQIGLLEYFNNVPNRILIGIDYHVFNSNPNDDNSYNNISVKFYGKQLFDRLHNITTIDFPLLSKLLEGLSFSYFQACLGSLLKYGLPDRDEDIVICDNDDMGKEYKICPNCKFIMNLSTYNMSIEDKDNNVKATIARGLEGGSVLYNKENFDYFIDLVEYLLNKNIEVTFYLPADYPEIRKYVEANPDLYQIDLIEEKIREYADKKSIVVHGTYNPFEIGLNKSDYADVGHGKPETILKNFHYIRNNE